MMLDPSDGESNKMAATKAELDSWAQSDQMLL